MLPFTIFLVLIFCLKESATTCVYDETNLCQGCASSIQIQNITSVHSSEITLYMCSKTLQLDHVLLFENSKGVSLLGLVEGKATLKCPSNANAGILIRNVISISISSILFSGCSFQYIPSGNNSTVYIYSAILITNSVNININEIEVAQSSGIGLLMVDSQGEILIKNSSFEENRIPNENSTYLSGGGGLYIDISHCNSTITDNNTIYEIHNCTFRNNVATQSESLVINEIMSGRCNSRFQELGYGGGLSVMLKGHAHGNIISIIRCKFLSNHATWGGGLYLVFKDEAINNTLLLMDTDFIGNNVPLNGGGGLDIGVITFAHYQTSKNPLKPINNSVLLENCRFENNNASYGGGLAVYATQSSSFMDLNNSITVNNCTWINNSALIGAAVDLSSHIWNEKNGKLPKIKFINCSFISNSIHHMKIKEKTYTSHAKGKGVFLSVGYQIDFAGNISFQANVGSALFLTSSVATFSDKSQVQFIGNKGFDGGAITLLGFSSIDINDNSVFRFINNSAKDKGGAILSITTNKMDIIATYVCFIHYIGDEKNVTKRNIHFLFKNNKAGAYDKSHEVEGHYGHSIFTSSLNSCNRQCLINGMNQSFEESFNCIANFTFINSTKYDISTSGKVIRRTDGDDKCPLKVIPGKLINLPVIMIDDLSHEVEDFYHVSVKNINNSNVSIDFSDAYISERLIRFYGKPGDRAMVTIETINIREIGISFTLKIDECPPGYVQITKMERKRIYFTCECSASTTDKRYTGIHRCNDTIFSALLKRGYWIGYDQKEGYGSEDNLYAGYCPRGFCFTNRPTETTHRDYILPSNTSVQALDNLICGAKRTGILCGSCTTNYSSYYHSSTYRCKNNTKCKWGLLLFLITEILPVTILFIVIIVFDIKLTTGAFNAFLYFAQVSDTILITANGFVIFPVTTYTFVRINHLITRMFNLNFFAIGELSFCLWKNAKTLDILVVKYITIAYSLILVIIIIATMQFCSCFRRCQMISRVRGERRNTKNTIIHGLTGFFVMCYSEYTRIALLLLTPVSLEKSSADSNNNVRDVVFYNGELTFLRGKHLYYALPALFILIILGILPPLLLIMYPLCYKIFAFFKISETKFVSILCKIMPLESFRPFFDSFQSSFKDEYRFFAGFYFIYRLTILLSFAFMHNLTEFYLLVQSQFVLILAVHSIVQPYKKKWHNIIDGLIFMILAILNAMTLFNYKHATELLDYQHIIYTICKIQTALLYIPLLYMGIFLSSKLYSKLNCKEQLKRLNQKRSVSAIDNNTECEAHILVLTDQGETDTNYLNDSYHYRSVVEEENID